MRGAAFGWDFFVFASAVAKHGWAKITNAPTSAGWFWDGYSERHSVTENAVLFGVSYKFGAPAAAARY